MYKILGADQQEYGPVTPEQIRQWVAEGRANAASLVQREGSTDWAPLSSLPEFNTLFAAQPPPGPGAPLPPRDPVALAEYVRTRSFDLDLGRCVGRSWELLKQNLGLLIGATLIFLVLIVVVNQVIGLFTRDAVQSLVSGNFSPGPILILMLANIPEMALSAVLSGGLYALLLKLVRGQPAGIGDLFAGFSSNFVQLALAGIVVQILVMLGILACLLPGVYLSAAWIFTVPLVMDRGLDFWSAMELSRKVVTPHWWRVFLLLVVIALISVVGFLACCIGVLLALPLGLGALIYAYEDIFGGPAAATY